LLPSFRVKFPHSECLEVLEALVGNSKDLEALGEAGEPVFVKIQVHIMGSVLV